MIREGLKLAAFRELHQLTPRPCSLTLVMMTQGDSTRPLMVNRILEVNGTNAQAWRLRGRIHRLKGNHMQAVDDLLKQEPQVRRLHQHGLARAYRQTNRMTAAIGELRSAADDPLAPPQRTMLEQFYMDAGQKNELRTFYAETLAKYAKRVLAFAARSSTCVKGRGKGRALGQCLGYHASRSIRRRRSSTISGDPVHPRVTTPC